MDSASKSVAMATALAKSRSSVLLTSTCQRSPSSRARAQSPTPLGREKVECAATTNVRMALDAFEPLIGGEGQEVVRAPDLVAKMEVESVKVGEQRRGVDTLH